MTAELCEVIGDTSDTRERLPEGVIGSVLVCTGCWEQGKRQSRSMNTAAADDSLFLDSRRAEERGAGRS